MRRRLLVVPALMTCISLVGCSANWNSIFRHENINGTQILSTDAKQRVVTSLPVGHSDYVGRIKPVRITCAEPSPDVAQALSQSVSDSLKVALTTKGSAVTEVANNFSWASAESIAQLGARLGTISLLRDKLYRACEGYANGAISATTYTIIMSRLDKTMTTMLLGELAAGASGRRLATIAGSAQSATLPAASLEDIQKARQDVLTEAERVRKQAKAVEDAKSEDEKNKAKEALKEAQESLTAKAQILLALEKAYASASTTSTPASDVGTIAGPQCCPTDTAVKQMAVLQKQYLSPDDDIRTLLDACITSLDIVRTPTPQQLTKLTEATTKAEAARQKMNKLAVGDERSESNQEFMRAQEEVQQSLSSDQSALANYCVTTGLNKIIDVIGKRPTEAANQKNIEVERAKVDAYVAQIGLCRAVVERSETKNASDAARECMKQTKPECTDFQNTEREKKVPGACASQ